MADVFISYAHEDDQVVLRLIGALGERNREVWVDARDIQPADRWKVSADEGIERSDAFLFVVSTDSLVSVPCLGELAHALSINKRLIPVCVDEDATSMDKPDGLAELDWTMLRPGDDFEQGVDRVVRALDTDLELARAHTRILVRARAWEQADRRTSPLLRGEELRAAEAWLLRAAAGTNPQPTELQRAFIAASRRTATRRLRLVAGVSVAVALAAVVLSIFALVQRRHAVAEARVALSGDIAAESSNTVSSNVALGSLLGLEAYTRAPTVEARSAIAAAVEQPLELVLPPAVGEVDSVAYDPDRPVMAIGGRHGVFLWDTKTNTMAERPFDTGQQANGVAFNPDGSELAVAQGNGKTALYKVSNASLITRLTGDGGGVSAVAFTPDGSTLAAATVDGDVYLWDLTTGSSSHFALGDNTALSSVTFNHDGSTLAVSGEVALSDGGTTGFVDEYAVGTAGEPFATFSEDLSSIDHVAFNPSGSLLAASDDNGEIFLLTSATAHEAGVIRDGASVSVPVTAFNPSGTLIATGDSRGIVRLWDPSTLQQVGPAMGDGSIVYGLAFSPDGRTLASGGLDGQVFVWTSTGRPPVTSTMQGRSSIQDLSTSGVGGYVATANKDGSSSVWSLRTKRLRAHLTDGQDLITSVEFAPHSTVLAIGITDGDVALYNVASGKSLADLHGAKAVVNFTAYTRRGNLLAVGYGNGAVWLWNAKTDRRIGTLPTGTSLGGVTALAFNPDGNRLAVAEEYGGVTLYNPLSPESKGVPVDVSESIDSLAYSTDGSELLAGDANGNVELLGATTHAMIGSLPGDGSTIYGMAVSPAGSTLATVDSGGTVQLWDLNSRFPLGTPLFAGSAIFSLDYSANGSQLVTGDMAGTVVLWPSLLWKTDLHVDSQDLCPRLRQNLTANQWNEYVSGQPYHAACPGYPKG